MRSHRVVPSLTCWYGWYGSMPGRCWPCRSVATIGEVWARCWSVGGGGSAAPPAEGVSRRLPERPFGASHKRWLTPFPVSAVIGGPCLLSPFILNLIAAAMRRYPYGGHMRLTLYLTPLVSILAAIGAAAIFQWLCRRPWLSPRQAKTSAEWIPRPAREGSGKSPYVVQFMVGARPRPAENRDRGRFSRLVWTANVVLLLLAAASVGRDFYLPGKEQQEIRKRDFAVWFWGSMERDHEVVASPPT